MIKVMPSISDLRKMLNVKNKMKKLNNNNQPTNFKKKVKIVKNFD